MARQPSSLLEEASAVIAAKMGAVKTASLIRMKDPTPHLPYHLAEVVAQAMAELKPTDFRELLKRTRDRRAAFEALYWIENRVPRWPFVALGFFEAFSDITFRGFRWKPWHEEMQDLFEKLAEEMDDWKLRRRHRAYTRSDFRYLVRFIGNGNDTAVMERTLQNYARELTYAQGAWLREQMRLRLRTVDRIAADQRERRIVRSGHYLRFN